MELQFSNWVEPSRRDPVLEVVSTLFDPVEVVGVIKMAEGGKTWLDSETAILVEAWSKDTIQKLLLGSKRNAKAFQKIVEVLADHDYE